MGWGLGWDRVGGWVRVRLWLELGLCWGGVGLWLKMGQDRERSEEVGYC